MHRDRRSTTRKSARVSNGPVGSATIPLPLPLAVPFYTHPHLLRPAPSIGPRGRPASDTMAYWSHEARAWRDAPLSTLCTGGGVCESIHRCLIWKRAGNFKSGAAPQPMLEFSCFPVSLASGPRSLAVFLGSPGRQPDGESNCQRPGPPSWQSRTSVFCFIVPVKCRLSRCGSVGFNCRGRCEGGSPSDEVLAVANIRPPVTGSSCTAASPKGRLGRWCTATPLRMSRPSRTGRASSGNASTPLSAAGFHSD